jgi:hypothetical protein
LSVDDVAPRTGASSLWVELIGDGEVRGLIETGDAPRAFGLAVADA